MIKVALGSNMAGGYVASIEHNFYCMWLETDPDSTAAEVCVEAAKLLRTAARRFELLGAEPAPTKIPTHNKINNEEVET